jgi:hypothetical protein
MTFQSYPPDAYAGLMPELIPIATQLEAELQDATFSKAGALETPVYEAPEAALPDEIADLPDHLFAIGESTSQAIDQTPGELDEAAAMLALRAADVDLTGVDLDEIKVAPPVINEPSDPGIDVGDAENQAAIPHEGLSASSEVTQRIEHPMPLLCTGFGSPGIPLPEDFDPLAFVTDPATIAELSKSVGVSETTHEVDFEATAQADLKSEEPPPWPFGTDEIPEVR